MSSYLHLPAFNSLRTALLEASYSHTNLSPALYNFIVKGKGRTHTQQVQQITDSISGNAELFQLVQNLLNALNSSAVQVDAWLGNAYTVGFVKSGGIDNWLNNELASHYLQYGTQIIELIQVLELDLDPVATENARILFNVYLSVLEYEIRMCLYLASMKPEGPGESSSLVQGIFRNWIDLLEPLRSSSVLRNFFSTMALHLGRYSDQPALETFTNTAFPGLVFERFDGLNRDAFKEGDLLARPVSLLNAGVSYAEFRSRLPLGTELDAETGEIYVSDPTLLVTGLHGGIQIQMTDAKGGTVTGTCELEFLPDREAGYAVMSPVSLETYQRGQVLAYIYDADGFIEYAQIKQGTIPPGVKFNAQNGTFTVLDPSRLEVGANSLQVTATDVTGGKSNLDLTLSFIYIPPPPGEENLPFFQHRPKLLADYENGDPLLTGQLTYFGNVSTVEMTYGQQLPPGVALRASSPEIYVSDASLLTENLNWYSVRVTFTDGHVIIFSGSMLLFGNNAFTYVMEPYQSISAYADNDLIASPPVGSTASTFFIFTLYGAGTPPGMVFDSTTGELRVANSNGTMQIESDTLYFVEADNQFFFLDIRIWPDSNITYNNETPKEIGDLVLESSLAYPIAAYKPIASATLTAGTLPPGVTLTTDFGKIKVSDVTQLQTGSWSITVVTQDTFGFEEEHIDMELTILPNS